jgi:hypothetical protein
LKKKGGGKGVGGGETLQIKVANPRIGRRAGMCQKRGWETLKKREEREWREREGGSRERVERGVNRRS